MIHLQFIDLTSFSCCFFLIENILFPSATVIVETTPLCSILKGTGLYFAVNHDRLNEGTIILATDFNLYHTP